MLGSKVDMDQANMMALDMRREPRIQLFVRCLDAECPQESSSWLTFLQALCLDCRHADVILQAVDQILLYHIERRMFNYAPRMCQGQGQGEA